VKRYDLVLDFETANTSPASACSIGIVVLEEYKVVHEAVFLIRPPTPVFMFTHVHGLTWEDVKHARTFAEIWESEISKWYEEAKHLVAHNVGFDERVLRSTLRHYGIEIPKIKTECTVKLARYKLGISPANLKNVSDTLGIELNNHEALSDARASAMVYIHVKTGAKPWEKAPKGETISSLNSEKSAALLKKLLTKN
jgi:DNA polymerase-3 subunit epsilon